MNRVFAGLVIIAKYDEDFDLHAEHDEVFAMYDLEKYGKMSGDDQAEMETLGWRWKDDCWNHYT